MALEAEDLKQIAALLATSQADTLKPLLARMDKLEKTEAPDVAALIAQALEDRAKDTPDPEVKTDPALVAKLKALETQLETQKQATLDADSARKTERMLSDLRTQLIAKKVPADRVDHVIAVLHHAEGRIGMDDTGKATLRFDRSSAGGDYTDTPTLDKGLTEWLETDAGKAFLPATRVQGSEAHNNSGRPLKGMDGKINTNTLINSILGAAVSQ